MPCLHFPAIDEICRWYFHGGTRKGIEHPPEIGKVAFFCQVIDNISLIRVFPRCRDLLSPARIAPLPAGLFKWDL
jgi:hypothetical protein